MDYKKSKSCKQKTILCRNAKSICSTFSDGFIRKTFKKKCKIPRKLKIFFNILYILPYYPGVLNPRAFIETIDLIIIKYIFFYKPLVSFHSNPLIDDVERNDETQNGEFNEKNKTKKILKIKLMEIVSKINEYND
ncbi:hypothetical protein BpHYR1_010133 [Brachionus plicatilis]|uniref:Uncharacterized protein n=1 Tax=Brachionus plicatilis TaxID=10195 RepID=A0A3M7RA36_BRAPC|nr:hypothetical protein BpHYR1_010133 [Brachionus plicatilis]